MSQEGFTVYELVTVNGQRWYLKLDGDFDLEIVEEILFAHKALDVYPLNLSVYQKSPIWRIRADSVIAWRETDLPDPM